MLSEDLKSIALPSPSQHLGGGSEAEEGDGHHQGKAHKLSHSAQPGTRSPDFEFKHLPMLNCSPKLIQDQRKSFIQDRESSTNFAIRGLDKA